MTAWATPIPASSRESEQQQEPLEALRLSGSSGTEQVTVNRRVPDTTPPPALPEFSERPTDQEIFEARVFYEPLVPGSGDVSHSENRALATALVDYSRVGGGEQVQAILDFLEKHPESRWRGALWTNVGMVYRATGYFTRALSAFETAWGVMKEETEPEPARWRIGLSQSTRS